MVDRPAEYPQVLAGPAVLAANAAAFAKNSFLQGAGIVQ